MPKDLVESWVSAERKRMKKLDPTSAVRPDEIRVPKKLDPKKLDPTSAVRPDEVGILKKVGRRFGRRGR